MADLEEIATLDRADPSLIRGASVLLRTSFDAFDERGNIKDGLRIETTEPTIRMLKEKGAERIIILTYAGRPEKNPAKEPKVGDNARYNGVLYDKRLSLRPTADFLYGLLKEKVHFISALREDGEFYEDAGDYVAQAREYLQKARGGDVVLLDNLRFWEGENSGDKPVGKEFARLIASLGSVYVQDGFAQAHRINNATVGELTRHVKVRMLGLQCTKEIDYLRGIFRNLRNPDRKPFVFIIGGKKIETKPGIVSKIDVASTLMETMKATDRIMVGGAMAYPFLLAREYLNEVRRGKEALLEKARGKQIKEIVGDSYLDWDQIHEQVMRAGTMLLKAHDRGIEVMLPVDHGVFTIGAKKMEVYYVTRIVEGMVGGDIGPRTVEAWRRQLAGAHTVVLAGPVGWYENEMFAYGSRKLVEAIAAETATNGTISIAAGGDTAEMVRGFGYGYKFSLVSIGGGATLEFLLRGTLPAFELLDRQEAIR